VDAALTLALSLDRERDRKWTGRRNRKNHRLSACLAENPGAFLPSFTLCLNPAAAGCRLYSTAIFLRTEEKDRDSMRGTRRVCDFLVTTPMSGCKRFRVGRLSRVLTRARSFISIASLRSAAHLADSFARLRSAPPSVAQDTNQGAAWSSSARRLTSYVAAALTRASRRLQKRSQPPRRLPSPWTGRGIWRWTRR
jgi:hypothetical protein